MNRDFWKTDWFIGLVVTVVFLVAASGESLQSLERKVYDLTLSMSAGRSAPARVTVVAIDEASVQRFGPWPWPRDVLAKAVRNVSQAQPKAIGLALDLHDAQNSRSLDYLKQFKALYANIPEKALTPEFTRRFDSLTLDAERALNTDQTFSDALREAGNVVLGVPYRVGAVSGSLDTRSLPPYMASTGYAMQTEELGVLRVLGHLLNPPRVPVAASFLAPAETMGRAAKSVGHFGSHVDLDGRTRFERLVVDYHGVNYPSLSLAVSALMFGVTPSDVRVQLGEGILVGSEYVATDQSLRLMPFFYKRKNGRSAFDVVSISDVMSGSAAPALFRERAVLFGLTQDDWVEPVTLPTGEQVPPVYVTANSVASMLNGDYYRVPTWAPWVELLMILMVASYLMSVLPRIGVGVGVTISMVAVVVLASAYIIVMATQGVWLKLAAPMLQLIIGHLILGAIRLYRDIRVHSVKENAEANRMLALAYQSQGQLDLAFEKFRKCPQDDGLADLLYALGLDYERKRQFGRASAVFRHITSFSPQFRDASKRILSNNEAASSAAGRAPSAGSGGGGTLVLKNNGVQKPMLGRYEVEKELGRGAMGMVYLGKDPKIDRVVAIKTMALSLEFEAAQLAEVKERFFREARTAGRLNHPNIVHIYDVGEEHDLAYIAMDFLEGVNLLPFTKADALLPLNEVFYIISFVAEALDYAHHNGVIHRDIKPANVVYDASKRRVTVTDFGVACLVDASKTKTGTILGTPSYMSPEQLGGKRVDGRSDFFSLGVMLFQMVTGELPFIGESLATLLYKIANEKHPDPRMFRPDLPLCVSRVIDKALRKVPDERFQNGKQFVVALKKCQQIIEASAQKVAS